MIEKGDNDIDMIDWPKNKIEDAGKFRRGFGLWFERTKVLPRRFGSDLINDDFDVSKPYLVPKRTKLNNNLPFRMEIRNLKTAFFATLIILN
jgi:hypothetical protein